MRIDESSLPAAYIDSFMLTLVGRIPEDDPRRAYLFDLSFPSISQAVELAGPDATPDEILEQVFLLSDDEADAEGDDDVDG